MTGHAGPISGAAAQPKRLAILALLTRAGDRGITRDKVLSFLWPDSDEERGRRVLAQAVYMLRRDLGADDVFAPGNDLQLNAERITSDVAEFSRAISDGRLDDAAALYAGPFLDGFRLAGAPEFERWVETERQSLAHDYAGVLDKLARGAEARGDTAGAIVWWRKLASSDPINARHAVGLMRALAASGDVTGALQHARVYEALVAQELDLEADREVVALAERLRATPVARGVDREPMPVAAPSAPRAEVEVVAEPVRARPFVPTRRIARWVAVAAGAAVAVAAITMALRSRPNATRDAPLLAIGRISDYTRGTDGGLGKPLTDMLATNLARVPAFRVVSTARLYELASQMGSGSDTAASALVAAARQAGATELLDGALYDLGDGGFRLDLRRIDLESGNVESSHSVTGASLFAIADSGTARLADARGAARPPGSIADVTTASMAAYRLYEQGLRTYYEGDRRTAVRLFDAALAEDSSFAMAAYYRALAGARDATAAGPEFARAVRLAERASDRERLTINAFWAYATSSPSLGALADTLSVRYPQEVEGHLYSGVALVVAGDFLRAVPPLRRAISMDSLGLSRAQPQCTACDAYRWLVSAYQLADSFPAAEREARRWTRLQPKSAIAWWSLGMVLGRLQRTDETFDALRTAVSFDPSRREGIEATFADYYTEQGKFDIAERLLREQTALPDTVLRDDAYWYLAILHRQQGRMAEALSDARRSRALRREESQRGAAPPTASQEAQVLLEAGRPRESAALFDSVSRWVNPSLGDAHRARARAWAMTHAAAGLVAAADTVGLIGRADTLRALGRQTGNGLHQRLHHHVRGLLFAARGDDEAAVTELRQAVYSLTGGYTRTNLELASALLRRGRATDAVVVLQPSLRSGLEASGLYVTRTELHELLARAWEAVGTPAARDSAAAHYTHVANAWAGGDPPYVARAAAARAAAAKLRTASDLRDGQ